MSQTNVMPFPGVILHPTTLPQRSVLPSFSSLATYAETYAGRLPWYAWFSLGAYFAYRVFMKK